MAKHVTCVACTAVLQTNVAGCQCGMCLPDEAAYHAAGWDKMEDGWSEESSEEDERDLRKWPLWAFRRDGTVEASGM